MSLFDGIEAALPAPPAIDILSLPRPESAVDLILGTTTATPTAGLPKDQMPTDKHSGADGIQPNNQGIQSILAALDMATQVPSSSSSSSTSIGSAFTPVARSDGTNSLPNSPCGSANIAAINMHGTSPGSELTKETDCSSGSDGTSTVSQNAQIIAVQYTEKEKRERKYECKHCKKRFTRPSSLTSHIYTHTGEKPFACDFPNCAKRFSVLSNLRRHYKVHSHRRSCYNGSGNGSLRNAAITGQVSARSGFSSHDLAVGGLACLPASHPYLSSTCARPFVRGLADRSRPSVADSGDRPSSYSHSPAPFPAIGASPAPLSFTSQRLQSGYAPSFRTTALLQSSPTQQAGACDTSTSSYGAAAGIFHSSLFAGIHRAGSASSSTAISATSGSNCASDTTSASPSPTSNSASRLACAAITSLTSGLDGYTSAPVNGLDAIHPPVQLQPSILNGTPSEPFGQASKNSGDRHDSIWPLAIGMPAVTSASASSANPLAGGETAISADNSTFSDIFQTMPIIATHAIATNASVTTKAMNGAIELNSSGYNSAMTPLPLLHAKHDPLSILGFASLKLPPTASSTQASVDLNGLDHIGGMVTAQYPGFTNSSCSLIASPAAAEAATDAFFESLNSTEW